MMHVSKLSSLHGVARIRKCAVLLERAEMSLARLDPEEIAAAPDLAYARSVADFLAKNPESSDDVRRAAAAFLAAGDGVTRGEALRPLNDFKHFLMCVSGQAPADWDLHDYCVVSNPAAVSGADNVDGHDSHAQGMEARAHAGQNGLTPGGQPGRAPEGLVQGGRPRSGLRVYLEDIRSPFNVGTIFRTAEALGFEEVLLSPQCADPCHPRALRSSMGTVPMMPWRRCTIEEAASFGPLFALELGGVSVYRFDFPASGILVLGSEELGVSRTARTLASRGIVSIPMRGNKASINVAVAFGIAASFWAEANSAAANSR